MSHDALRTILPVAGLDPERARVVEFTGGLDPILPTSFKIGETAAACLGAISTRKPLSPAASPSMSC